MLLKEDDAFKKSDAPKLSSRDDKPKYEVTCFACGKVGHKAPHCPDQTDKKSTKQNVKTFNIA